MFICMGWQHSSCLWVSLSLCFTVSMFLSYSCLKACLSDNPHTLSVNKRVGVTLPVSFLPIRQAVHLSIGLSFCLCGRLLVSDTYLRALSPNACSFSISYCQLGWSHTQIACYLNEHPTLMPLYVSALCKPFFQKLSGFISSVFKPRLLPKCVPSVMHDYLFNQPTAVTWLFMSNQCGPA